MTRRHALRAVAAIHLVASTALVAGCIMLVLGRPALEPEYAAWVLGMYSFALVGGVLGLRVPTNPISWIFIGIGFFGVLEAGAQLYGERATILEPGVWPGQLVAAWLSDWTFFPVIFLVFICLPILFPDGRPATARGQLLLRSGGVILIVLVSAAALGPELRASGEVMVPNPLAVGFLAPVAGPLTAAGLVLGAGHALLAVGSLVLRARRTTGVERQQVRWLTSALALACIGFLAVVGAEGLLDGTTTQAVVILAWGVTFACIPVAACLAILRYRLYDLDRLISRTITWAIVSSSLVGLYVLAVMGFGAVLRSIGGSGDLIVAASTLAIAAAFQPLRRRVQGTVDRRFNRARFDSQREIAGFRERLRDDADLGVVSDELVGVVRRTVDPTTAHLWLRPGTAER